MAHPSGAHTVAYLVGGPSYPIYVAQNTASDTGASGDTGSSQLGDTGGCHGWIDNNADYVAGQQFDIFYRNDTGWHVATSGRFTK
jgi:hypothetical protein